MSDNYEEKNLTEAARKERFLAMEQLLTVLYCRDVFHDFRKPVEVMYPHLAATYHSVIKRPMDLGTLLLKAKKQEILTVHELRTNLQLVHNNALHFNEGAPLMEAVSRHLEFFTAGLFEEIMRLPYHIKADASAAALVKPEAFQQVRATKRNARIRHVRDQPLEYSEIRKLSGILSDTGGIPVPQRLQPVVAEAVAVLTLRLACETDASAMLETITLRTVLQSIFLEAGVQMMLIPEGLPAPSPKLVDLILPMPIGSRAHYPLPGDCLAFTQHLEERVGVLAVLVEERLLRGTPYSSIWAVPSDKFVYAQSISMTTSTDGKSRSPWWPCMVVAGSTGASSERIALAASVSATGPMETDPEAARVFQYSMPTEVLRANLGRFPADIVKQLTKLRPRTATAAPVVPAAEGAAAPSAESGGDGLLSVPEGYLLLEYFGAHDFGWVKAESVFPMFSYSTRMDGTVEVVKSPAPGKLSFKDSVIEAEEAWAVLHRRRRHAGLVPSRTFLRTLAAAAPPTAAAPMSAAGSVGDEDDVAFLPAAETVLDMSEALSEYSGGNSKEGQDLVETPGVKELEESVEVAFSAALFGAATQSNTANGISSAATGAAQTTKPTAATAKPPAAQKSSNKRKPSTAAPEGYFEDPAAAAGAPPGTYYVPGPRKGTFVPALAPKTYHFPTEREDKRLYFATPEEILRYRASVEYVLPEDVTVDDYRRCFEEGRFRTSVCPLPLPSMESLASPATKRAEDETATPKVDGDLIVVDDATRSTFRPKALMRTRALSFYLNTVRPLHLDHYTPTPSKKGFPAIPPGISVHSAAVHAASLAAAAAAAAQASSAAGASASVGDLSPRASTGDLTGMLLSGEDSLIKITKTNAESQASRAEKRKYVFKPKSGAEDEAAGLTLPPLTTANIHIPANLTLSASCFLLDAGCTRYAAGDGSVYTRIVNVDAKLFHLEARSRAARKRILREELASLQLAIEQLQQVSQQRQLRENERKLRFQQLQQQQLQQQMHQQQYQLAQQQQHQQYLMKLIDQQHQLQGQQRQPATPGQPGPPPAKKPTSRPKPAKPVVNADGTIVQPEGGVPAIPKPRSKPNSNGASVPTAALEGSDMPLDGLVDGASISGGTIALPVPAPKKKSRPAEGDGNGAPKRPKAQKSKVDAASRGELPGMASPAGGTQEERQNATPDLSVLASAAASILEAAMQMGGGIFDGSSEEPAVSHVHAES